MGKVIQALIFLVLIGGVVVGAKMFILDPMNKDRNLQAAKSDIGKAFAGGEYRKAINGCDELIKNHPKQKEYVTERKFDIYVSWAENEYNAMLENERLACKTHNKAKAKEYTKWKVANAKRCLSCVNGIEECGEIRKVHQQWRSIAYGVIGEKKKAREAMKRQAKMKD